MRSFRPLRLEALEDRTAPTDVTTVVAPNAVLTAALVQSPTVVSPVTAATTAAATTTGTVVGGAAAAGATTTPTTTTSTSSLGPMLDPIGTPVNP
jgi:hypothetical protein